MTGQEKVTYLGRSPTRAIYIKNCCVGDVLDVIKCAKFQNEIFRGYDFTKVNFSIFLLISAYDTDTSTQHDVLQLYMT